MNKTVKALWVAALRSGKYQQGQYRLRSPTDKFCCLGVLCNLHAQAHPEIAIMNDDALVYCGEGCILPSVVREWADLEANPWVGTSTLARMNDIGTPFEKIAEVIEEYL